MNESNIKTFEKSLNTDLFRMLDRGIDDMEAGREFTLEEAFEEISELRNIRRKEYV